MSKISWNLSLYQQYKFNLVIIFNSCCSKALALIQFSCDRIVFVTGQGYSV